MLQDHVKMLLHTHETTYEKHTHGSTDRAQQDTPGTPVNPNFALAPLQFLPLPAMEGAFRQGNMTALPSPFLMAARGTFYLAARGPEGI